MVLSCTVRYNKTWPECCIMSPVCLTKLLHTILKTYLTQHHLSWNPKPWHHLKKSQRMSLHDLFMSGTTVKACSTSLFHSLRISLRSSNMNSLPPDSLIAEKLITFTWRTKQILGTLLCGIHNTHGLCIYCFTGASLRDVMWLSELWSKDPTLTIAPMHSRLPFPKVSSLLAYQTTASVLTTRSWLQYLASLPQLGV